MNNDLMWFIGGIICGLLIVFFWNFIPKRSVYGLPPVQNKIQPPPLKECKVKNKSELIFEQLKEFQEISEKVAFLGVMLKKLDLNSILYKESYAEYIRLLGMLETIMNRELPKTKPPRPEISNYQS